MKDKDQGKGRNKGLIGLLIVLIGILLIPGYLLLSNLVEKRNPVRTMNKTYEPVALPAHWTPISEPVLPENLAELRDATQIDFFVLNDPVTELPTPVLPMIRFKCQRTGIPTEIGALCVAKTDAFETTADPGKAKTVLLITVDYLEFANKPDSLTYECYAFSRNGKLKTYLQLDGVKSQQKYSLSEGDTPEIALSREADEAYFSFLAEHIRFAPDAADDLPAALEFFSTYAPDPYIDLITSALAEYSYPAEADLAQAPELLDPKLPVLCFSGDPDPFPENSDPAEYQRPQSVKDIIWRNDRADAIRQDVSVWGSALRGESVILLCFCESIGTAFYGSYTGAGNVYRPICRLTLVNASSGEVVGWYIDPTDAREIAGRSINKDKLHKIGGRNYISTAYSLAPELMKSLIKKVEQSENTN